MGTMLSSSDENVDISKAKEMLNIFEQLTEMQKMIVLGYTYGLRDSIKE